MTDRELNTFVEQPGRIRRRRRFVKLTIAVVVVLLVASAGVFAYFKASGSGSANASVGTVNPPTNVVAKAANGSSSLGAAPVTITWTAPSAGVTPTGYQVKRDDGTTQTTLACTASPCTDSTVGNGTYTYHVKSLYHSSWTSAAADSNSLMVQNQVATTTTLSSSANPSVVGQTVTYTATVSAGAVVPGGTVDFKDGSTTVCSARPLTGSSPYQAACQQTYVATSAGHAMTAVYSGDSGTFGSTSSPALSQVVNKAATTTGLSSSVNPSVVGQPVTFTATVAVSAPGAATPTGTVDFKDGSTTVCAARPLTGSAPYQATCQQTYATAGGSHSLTAVYSGDGVTSTSTSAPAVSQVVNAASTTTSLSSEANPSVFGQLVTFDVAVSANAPGAGTPTGTVAVKEGSTTVCTATLSGGAGSCSSAALSVATHSLTATYSATSNFASSTSSPALGQVANKASTSTALASSANPSVTGQSVTYTATVSATAPGAGTRTGSVTFKDGSSTITCTGGTQTVNGSGVATCTVSAGYAASGGSHTISAVYSGDGNFLTSTSSNLTQAVNKANTATGLASSQNPSVSGQSVTYTATVTSSSPGSGTPTGSVAFKDGGSTISCTGGTQTLNGSGVATCTVSNGYLASGGSHTISAVYSGDGDYNTSTSSNLSQGVNKAATTTTVVTAKTPTVVGEQVSYTGGVSATAPGTGNPSAGNIEFFDGGAAITACGGSTGLTVDSNGNAVCTLTYAAVGTHTIKAQYLGTSGDYFASGSQSSAITQTVSQASTTTTLGSSANPSVFGQSVTLTATVAPVAPAGGTPTGNVNFKDGASTISGCGTQALNGSGQATCTTSALTTGTHATITAVYAGTTAYATSTSSNFTQTVNKADTTTSVVSGTNPSVTGLSVSFTATVAAASPGAGTPGGTVNFTSDGVTISGCGTAALAAGQATCVTTFDAANGNHSVTATYAGSGDFNTSTDATPVAQTVNKGATATALISSKNPTASGVSVTFTATITVTAPAVGTPTGTVNFKDGATSITGCATQPLSGTSPFTATCTTSALSVASHTITAVYFGDNSFATSTSTGVTQVVDAQPTVTSTSPSSRGQGFTGNITINGTGFLSGATVSFFGSGVNVNSVGTITSTTISVNITVTNPAATGSRNVTVTNTDGGAVTANSVFTVNAGPTVSSPNGTTTFCNPGHNGTANCTITGTGFVNGVTVTISNNATVNSVTFNSSTQITINVKGSGGSGAKGDITVTNPDGGTVTVTNGFSNG